MARHRGSHSARTRHCVCALFSLLSVHCVRVSQVGIQIEEPFSILPLEAFTNGAISATMDENLKGVESGVFDYELQ